MTPVRNHIHEPNSHKIEIMGYDFGKDKGLCFNKGHRTPLQPCVPTGKSLDYYSKTQHFCGTLPLK